MSFRVRFTGAARDDLKLLFEFLLEQDVQAARRARDSIVKATEFLADFPFSCRKADAGNPFLRELIIPFGRSGYVALFEIVDTTDVVVSAVRHQLEDDYH